MSEALGAFCVEESAPYALGTRLTLQAQQGRFTAGARVRCEALIVHGIARPPSAGLPAIVRSTAAATDWAPLRIVFQSSERLVVELPEYPAAAAGGAEPLGFALAVEDGGRVVRCLLAHGANAFVVSSFEPVGATAL